MLIRKEAAPLNPAAAGGTGGKGNDKEKEILQEEGFLLDLLFFPPVA